jgi:hypothetical protein
MRLGATACADVDAMQWIDAERRGENGGKIHAKFLAKAGIAA